MAMRKTHAVLLNGQKIEEIVLLLRSVTSNWADSKVDAPAISIKSFLDELIDSLIESKRDSNLVSELRSIDQLISSVKKLPRECSLTPLWENITHAIVLSVWATVSITRINRKLLQLSSEVEKIFPECIARFQKQHHTRFSTDSDTQLLSLWSCLICQTVIGKQLVTVQLDSVLQVISAQLKINVNDASWTMHRQQHLQSLVKFVLDLLQHIKSPIIRSINNAAEDPTHAGEYWQIIIENLILILQLEGSPKDSCLLAATAITQLLLMMNNPNTFGGDVHDFFHQLNSGGDMMFGRLRCSIDAHGGDTLTFGHLSLLHGVLAVADAEVMSQRINKINPTGHCLNQITNSTNMVVVIEEGSSNSNSARIMSNSEEEAQVDELLLTWLHKNLCRLTLLPGAQYQAFRLLAQFFNKCSKLLSQIHTHVGYRIFTPNGSILTQILDLVWTHLDSPVDGVNESVLDIFKGCLTVVKLEMEESSPTSENSVIFDSLRITDDPLDPGPSADPRMSVDLGSSTDEVCPKDPGASGDPGASVDLGVSELDCLISEILDVLLKMSWQVRGRHNLVAVLLGFSDILQILRGHTHIMTGISQCLATNYLTPAATNLYSSIINGFSKIPTGLEMWKETCLHMLLDALTSTNQLIRHNASQHLLPLTLKKMPKSFVTLQDLLEQKLHRSREPDVHMGHSNTRECVLYGYLALLKTARNCQLLKDWPVAVLREALVHPENDIRLDAFCLICVSPKKSEPLSMSEQELLRSSLDYNMNIDEPPFRSQLQMYIRCTVSRSRDHALVSLKHLKTKAGATSDALNNAIGYLDWLWRLCLHHLHPGSNYQRLKTSLDWSAVVLDSLTVQLDKRKGGCPEQTPLLLEYATAHDQLCLYTPHSCLALLSCMLHDTDEIKQQVVQILEKFFPWPLPLQNDPVMPTMLHETQLLNQAILLCNSRRARETESGAALCRVIYNKYVLKGGHQFRIHIKDNLPYVTYEHLTDGEIAAIHFIEDIIHILELGIDCAHKSILTAARILPSHGMVLACHQCLRLCAGHVREPHRWLSVSKHLLHVSNKLIDLSLQVFGANMDAEECAPSFEKMGVAIQKIAMDQKDCGSPPQIENSNSELIQACDMKADEGILTPQQQMVMSWCWLNIKGCSLLLSSLIENLPVGSDINDPRVSLVYADVHQAAETLVKILTKCRHRGAIEGCNNGFLQLCTNLLSSSEQELYNIPCILLDKILHQLEQLSQTSVTRRSAGLPLIVQSIVASEAKTKQNKLLTKAVSSLLAVIQKPLPSSHNQQEDLPHVHALNILKAIFREKSVSQTIMSHISSAFISAIDLLSSPFWAVRNSAMQLYGTLQSRMLGQKKTADDHLHTTTAPEFFTLFPDLHPYMMSKVKDAAASLSVGQLRLHPSLFPVLSILAKFSPGLGSSDLQKSLDEFRQPIESLAASPLYAVRKLSADALLALVPHDTVLQYTLSTARQLPACRQECTGYNLLHGRLIQLQLLVTTHQECKDSLELCSILSSKLWLLRDENPCYMVKSAFTVLIRSLCNHEGLDKILTTTADHMLISTMHGRGEDGHKVGHNEYSCALTSWWLTHSSSCLADKVTQCLSHNSGEVRLACLNWLADHSREIYQEDGNNILNQLVSRLKNEPSWEELCVILKLIIDISITFDQISKSQFSKSIPSPLTENRFLWNHLLFLLEKERNSQPAAFSLAVLALVVKTSLQEEHNFDEILQWTKMIKTCSAPINTESLREHCALSLCITGQTVLQYFTERQTAEHTTALLNILDTCLQLLHDECATTRNMSAKLVAQLAAQLTNSELEHLHHNTAMKKLMDLMSDILPVNQMTISWLYNRLILTENLTVCIKNIQARSVEEQFEASDINPYEEVVISNSYVLSCLKNIVNGRNDLNIDDWIEHERAALFGNVKEVVNLIKSSPEEAVLNVTYSKPVYEGLHGLQCRARALDYMSPRNQDIFKMLQIPTNHPSLWEIDMVVEEFETVEISKSKS